MMKDIFTYFSCIKHSNSAVAIIRKRKKQDSAFISDFKSILQPSVLLIKPGFAA